MTTKLLTITFCVLDLLITFYGGNMAADWLALPHADQVKGPAPSCYTVVFILSTISLLFILSWIYNKTNRNEKKS